MFFQQTVSMFKTLSKAASYFSLVENVAKVILSIAFESYLARDQNLYSLKSTSVLHLAALFNNKSNFADISVIRCESMVFGFFLGFVGIFCSTKLLEGILKSHQKSFFWWIVFQTIVCFSSVGMFHNIMDFVKSVSNYFLPKFFILCYITFEICLLLVVLIHFVMLPSIVPDFKE